MSAVLTPSIIPDQEYLKGLIRSVLREEPELVKSVIREDKELLKSSFIELLEEDKEFKEYVRGFIDCSITMSEHNVLKRLAEVEKATGQRDYSDFEEEHKPTIQEQINVLAEKIENKPTEPLILPKTTAEKRTVAFVEKFLQKPHSPTGVIQADDKEIKEIINGLPEELRSKDKNERKVKERIINKAKELYPGIIEIRKSPHGRHETSVYVKDSYQSNRTVRTPIMLAGEFL